ncbi:MAG: hypothetical protein AAF125_07005 [Chloroflexota bacterium]
MTETPFDFRASLTRYQQAVLRVYVIGVIAMTVFNWNCYPGTFIGVCGWAALWPIYIPAMIIQTILTGDTVSIGYVWGELCQGTIAGVR